VLADKRNEILSKLQEKGLIEIDERQKIGNLPYFKGWEIYFRMKDGTRYQWWDCLKKLDKDKYEEIEEEIKIDNLENYLTKQHP
jgi:hypothetical protein